MADTFSIVSEHPVHGSGDLGPAGDKGEGFEAPPKDSQAPATAGGGGTEPERSDSPAEMLSSPKGGTTSAPH